MTQAVHWWTSRGKVRADTFKTMMDTVQNRLGATETRLDHVEGQHENCERELSAVRVRLDASERDREELRREIERPMSAPVPGYKPRMPK